MAADRQIYRILFFLTVPAGPTHRTVLRRMSVSAGGGPPHNSSLLEELAVKHSTDKMRAKHKYVDFYEPFFGPRRLSILNVTEIGVQA